MSVRLELCGLVALMVSCGRPSLALPDPASSPLESSEEPASAEHPDDPPADPPDPVPLVGPLRFELAWYIARANEVERLRVSDLGWVLVKERDQLRAYDIETGETVAERASCREMNGELAGNLSAEARDLCRWSHGDLYTENVARSVRVDVAPDSFTGGRFNSWVYVRPHGAAYEDEIRHMLSRRSVTDVAISGDDQWLAVIVEHERLYVCDPTDDPDSVRPLDTGGSQVGALSFSPDSAYLFASHPLGPRVYTVPDGQVETSFEGSWHNGSRWINTETIVALASHGPVAYRLDESGAWRLPVPALSFPGELVDVAPSGRWICASSSLGQLACWSVSAREPSAGAGSPRTLSGTIVQGSVLEQDVTLDLGGAELELGARGKLFGKFVRETGGGVMGGSLKRTDWYELVEIRVSEREGGLVHATLVSGIDAPLEHGRRVDPLVRGLEVRVEFE